MNKRLNEIAEELTQIETRFTAIKDEVETADLERCEALSAELTEAESRRAELLTEKAEIEAREAEANAIQNGEVRAEVIEKTEGKKMELNEIRASQEYLNAYAEYMKTGDDTECRSVLTDNGTSSGATGAGVPTATYVEEKIRTAWDSDDIMSRVRKSFVKGNLKVGFELSATDAGVHTEGVKSGDGFVAEEALELGIVTLVAETLKKWITLSDEVMDMHGQTFIDFIFDEITYRLIKKATDLVLADIINSPTSADKDEASVANTTVSSASIHDFVDAIATLSDEAKNPVIIMNKGSYATYRGLQMAANYGVDPFDGMPVIFNNTLYAVASATAGQAIAIVGDLDGVQCNFPNGYAPTFKYDDLSLAEADLIKIVGRLPMAHDVTACGRFCVIKKAS